MLIPKHDVVPITRFALRQIIWCKLLCDQMFVHFGDDYYMFIGSEKELENEIEAIRNNGLFVEEMKSPYM